MRRRDGKRSKQRGAVAVEFALSLFFLVPLLLGTLDYGYYFWVGVNAVEAARLGAREAGRLGSTNAVAACGSGPNWTTLVRPTVEGTTGAAKVQMQQAGVQAYTTVTLNCLTAPTNPSWQLVLEVNFPPAVGFLNPWMPASTSTPGYVRYRVPAVVVPNM
jgi:Flp pilus assembly protein TadG